MSLEISAKMLFSDTVLPDIFIKEYLPVLDGDSVRVYIYCVFIATKASVDPTPISDILGLGENQLNECLTKLESFGLINQRSKKVVITDLKEKELIKYYRPKTSLDPEKPSLKRNSSIRTNTVKHISDTFFAGQMSNSWYGVIDLWYEKYSFDDAVMVMLFSHCAQNLAKNGQNLSRGREYVRKVAENWAREGIQTPDQLERYLMEYDKYKVFRNTIVKKASIKNLDEYQETVISKWYFDYKYTFDIVEEALKKSVSLKNASVGTYDLYISEWFKAGLKTKEAVISYEEEKKQKYRENKKKSTPAASKPTSPVWNYEGQRQIDDDFFERLEKRQENNK